MIYKNELNRTGTGKNDLLILKYRYDDKKGQRYSTTGSTKTRQVVHITHRMVHQYKYRI